MLTCPLQVPMLDEVAIACRVAQYDLVEVLRQRSADSVCPDVQVDLEGSQIGLTSSLSEKR